MADAELSHVVGANTPPLLEYTIGEALARAAQQWPERLALISVHQGISWTYRELLDRADHLAAGFLKLGVQPDDRIDLVARRLADTTDARFGDR